MPGATVPTTSFPRAAGVIDQTNKAIAIKFSTRILMAMYAATVLSMVTTTEYQGDLKQGHTVRIRKNATVTIHEDYQAGQPVEADDIDMSFLDMTVDQSAWYSIHANIIDLQQSDVPMVNLAKEDASKQLVITLEKNVFRYAYTEALHTGAAAGLNGDINLGSSGNPLVLTPDNIQDHLSDMCLLLDERNVHDEGRFLLLPPKLYQTLMNSDTKNASFTGDPRSTMRTNKIPNLYGFDIIKTNNLTTVTDGSNKVCNVIAGHKNAIGFAAAFEHSEVKPHKAWGDQTQALTVYARKVLRDYALIHSYAKVA